jgi:hypothetical protein
MKSSGECIETHHEHAGGLLQPQSDWTPNLCFLNAAQAPAWADMQRGFSDCPYINDILNEVEQLRRLPPLPTRREEVAAQIAPAATLGITPFTSRSIHHLQLHSSLPPR